MALNEEANRRRVLDGLKGGELFQSPVMLPPLQFKDGAQRTGDSLKSQTAGMEKAAPGIATTDPWYGRR